MKTDDSQEFGFGVEMSDGSNMMIDTPEQLEQLIAEDPEMTFDIIILLASRLYHEVTISKALEERLASLSGNVSVH